MSAHFWLPKSGQPYQHVDTNVRAYHGVNHNGYSIGVETEGCGAAPHAEPLTEHQLNTFARLMVWARATHGIPLQLSESITQPGLNYHRCAGGPATGCPCDVRKNARAEILRRAGAGPAAPTPGDDDLPLNDADKKWINDTIFAQVQVALRTQLQPDWECFNRVVQAASKAIQSTPANVPR